MAEPSSLSTARKRNGLNCLQPTKNSEEPRVTVSGKTVGTPALPYPVKLLPGKVGRWY
jgi:hypothetical protein